MAQKKVTKKVAKKAPAKKVAKKAPAKKAAAKKVAKKAVVKKAAVKKRAAKKVASKKAPAKKVAAKKTAVKKVAAKKSAAKKVAKKTAKRQVESIVIPPVPGTNGKTVTAISTTPAPKAEVPAPTRPTAAAAQPAAKRSLSRVVVTVIAGVALLALAVVSKNHSSSTSTTDASATPSASASTAASTTASASASATASAASTAAAPSAADASHGAPVGIVAHYTASGATIFWKADSASTGLTNFNVEISSNGGAWKLISTVPASQLSLDITKGDTTGWCSFRVSAVYSDGKVVGGKVFGLPGQYA